MNVYQCLTYETIRLFVSPVYSTLMRMKIDGARNIPAEGGALIVCNHRNPIFDPMSIACCVERPVNFIAASVAFKLPGISQLFRAIGATQMDVFGGRKSEEDMDNAVQLLQEGELVGVFPEGVHTIAHLNSVAKIRNFRTGFARIALRARVPIIPATVIGMGERNLPRIPPALVKPLFDHPEFQDGVRWTYYRRVRVRVGRPVYLDSFYDEDLSKELIDQLSGKIRRIVIKLYDGDDLDRFLTGETPFDIFTDRV